MDCEMSDISGQTPQGTESVPVEMSQSGGPSLASEMQTNMHKMVELVSELHQEKINVMGLQRQTLELEGDKEDQDVIQNNRIQQLERLVLQMSQFNEERNSILLQLQKEMSNYATIQSKFQEQEQSMEMIIKELQQKNHDLEKERDDLKEALTVKEIVGLEEIEQLDDELADMSKEMVDLNNKIAKMTEATLCPLCLASWNCEGSHRVATVRCGHLFGKSCLRECIERLGCCPICREQCNLVEVRNIYIPY